ncbi:MAG: hypothetical protein ACE5JI_04550 [Acidobacteriota bacterium]
MVRRLDVYHKLRDANGDFLVQVYLYFDNARKSGQRVHYHGAAELEALGFYDPATDTLDDSLFTAWELQVHGPKEHQKFLAEPAGGDSPPTVQVDGVF